MEAVRAEEEEDMCVRVCACVCEDPAEPFINDIVLFKPPNYNTCVCVCVCVNDTSVSEYFFNNHVCVVCVCVCMCVCVTK